MTAKKKNPIPAHISGRMGGLTTSQDREHMSRIGYRGAMANLEKNGADQPLRASLIRRGYKVATIAPSRKNVTPGEGNANKSHATG